MARRDGEEWLEAQPIEPGWTGLEPGSSARRKLRDPVFWAILLVVAAAIGTAAEAIGALLGDGHFDLSAGLRDAVPAFVGALGPTAFAALRR
jgi:hypothetical protein